jgi:hypothetical protein
MPVRSRLQAYRLNLLQVGVPLEDFLYPVLIQSNRPAEGREDRPWEPAG